MALFKAWVILEDLCGSKFTDNSFNLIQSCIVVRRISKDIKMYLKLNIILLVRKKEIHLDNGLT